MWSRLRETVAGMAEQAGIEIPGLDAAGATISDLAASADPTELVTGATDAVASAGDAAQGAADQASTTASGLLDAIKGDLAP
jgi:hypothetical protein